MVCKNCNNQFQEKFCGFCGQSIAMNEKIKAKDLITDIFHSIFHTGGGLIFTLKKLFQKPESVIEGYLGGKRKIFFSPIKLFLIFGVFYLATSHFVNEKETDLLTKNLDYYMSHYKYLVMFMLVLFSTIFNWFIYKKKQLSFTEHFIVIMYIQSIIYMIGSIFMIINYVLEARLIVFSIFLQILFYVYATTRLYSKEKIVKGILLNLFIYFIVMLFYVTPFYLLVR